MPSTDFEDVTLTAGLPLTDPSAAVTFLTDWWGRSDAEWAVVSSIMATERESNRTRHWAFSPADQLDTLAGDPSYIEAVSTGSTRERPEPWNAYFSVGLLGRQPEAGRKGGRADVARLPGLWIDLDCKPGSFSNEDEALQMLRELPPEVWPTSLVATGTGGVHGYWKTDLNLSADEGEKLCEMWWALLSERSGVHIDKLTNADRVMKLPGTIRWPKKRGEVATPVRLIYHSQRTVRCYDIQLLAQGALERWNAVVEERRAQARTSYSQTRAEALRLSGQEIDLSDWNTLLEVSEAEEDFTERYTWNDVLASHGWTDLGWHGTRRHWARPGSMQKSATTDWEESPDVMSLFSDAEETGLRRLLDADVPLTKYRVYIELTWNGDEAAYLRHRLSDNNG
jgi:hypothetical protein